MKLWDLLGIFTVMGTTGEEEKSVEEKRNKYIVKRTRILEVSMIQNF